LRKIAGPPATTSGCSGPRSALRAGRPELEHADQIQVVGLERDREREQIAVGDPPAALQRAQTAGRDGLVLIGEKGAFADDVVGAIEQLVDDLEPEVPHRHRIAVRVGETDAARGVLLLGEADLLGAPTPSGARLGGGELRQESGG